MDHVNDHTYAPNKRGYSRVEKVTRAHESIDPSMTPDTSVRQGNPLEADVRYRALRPLHREHFLAPHAVGTNFETDFRWR